MTFVSLSNGSKSPQAETAARPASDTAVISRVKLKDGALGRFRPVFVWVSVVLCAAVTIHVRPVCAVRLSPAHTCVSVHVRSAHTCLFVQIVHCRPFLSGTSRSCGPMCYSVLHRTHLGRAVRDGTSGRCGPSRTPPVVPAALSNPHPGTTVGFWDTRRISDS